MIQIKENCIADDSPPTSNNPDIITSSVGYFHSQCDTGYPHFHGQLYSNNQFIGMCIFDDQTYLGELVSTKDEPKYIRNGYGKTLW